MYYYKRKSVFASSMNGGFVLNNSPFREGAKVVENVLLFCLI